MRIRGFVDLTAGIALLPLIALGLYVMVVVSHDSIVELGRLTWIMRVI